MPDQDRYIPGVPCWVDVALPEPEAALGFYGGVFGWEFENSMPEGSPGQYFTASIDGQPVGAVGSQPEGFPSAWNTYVWTNSADESASTVGEAGGSVLMEPFDIPGAGRMAFFADREGAAFGVWEAREHRGAGLVNAHGSLNFNDLHTRDADAAAAFYGPVFGWEELAMPEGFRGWTLPGYGEFLDRINPGTLANMKEMGAPEGFENVVASMIPIGEDQPDAPPHWGVTFAVDSADSAAESASSAGGEILMPPTDMPWVRATVIRDPQGATFTASQFVPENR